MARARKSLSIPCTREYKNYRGKITRYNSNHLISTGKIIAYLTKNPTLDETKPPLDLTNSWCRTNENYVGKGREKFVKSHTISVAAIRAHVAQHPDLKNLVFTKTIEVQIVERPFGASDAELDELRIALQRQQHIRNEYVRRAYEARKLSENTGNQAVYQAELDAALSGANTLRALMERLEIPAAVWTDNSLALAQLPLIEAQEAARDLHV